MSRGLFDLTGKVVLATGANSGVGLACPLAALALFSGMKVMRKAMAVEEAEGTG